MYGTPRPLSDNFKIWHTTFQGSRPGERVLSSHEKSHFIIIKVYISQRVNKLNKTKSRLSTPSALRCVNTSLFNRTISFVSFDSFGSYLMHWKFLNDEKSPAVVFVDWCGSFGLSILHFNAHHYILNPYVNFVSFYMPENDGPFLLHGSFWPTNLEKHLKLWCMTKTARLAWAYRALSVNCKKL